MKYLVVALRWVLGWIIAGAVTLFALGARMEHGRRKPLDELDDSIDWDSVLWDHIFETHGNRMHGEGIA